MIDSCSASARWAKTKLVEEFGIAAFEAVKPEVRLRLKSALEAGVFPYVGE